MPRNQLFSALAVVVMALAGVIYTVVAANEPLLGLDLQGGVSVVLEPTSEAEISDESLELTVELLRSRIDQIGVAEPEISRQGSNIVVSLPGVVEDQQQALERLQQTAELRFRPVIMPVGINPEMVDDAGADDDGADDASTDDDGADDADGAGADDDGADGAGADGAGADGAGADGADGADDADGAGADDAGAGDAEESLGVPLGRYGPLLVAQETTSTTAEGTSEADGSEGTSEAELPELTAEEQQMLEFCTSTNGEPTPDEQDLADAYVVLEDRGGVRMCLGPTLLTGEIIETASVGAGFNGWEVHPVFKSGAEGIDKFNEIAEICHSGEITCPTTQLAIVLDHRIIFAPTIDEARFSRDRIVISGAFEEQEARLLQESLRFGALPFELIAQETRSVSATIGRDVLRSGIVAGLIGLLLVAIYLLLYYRLAGLVAILGLLLSAAMLWTIIAWFGSEYGLALTLAGVVGLIVSIGVAADSNIVYFENVKESYASGRRLGTAIERAYQSSISTIVKADVVSLIAASLLYLLTVGAVRGFAFYLGLGTILDLIISFMFMRPALKWLASLKAVENKPSLLGLRSSPTADSNSALGVLR